MSAHLSPLSLMMEPAAVRQLLHPAARGGYGPAAGRLQVRELEDAYQIDVDAPGLSPADVKLSIEDGVLSVEGKREEKKEETDANGTVLYSEKRSSAFARSIQLPDNADAGEIHARAQDGVVHIVVKKKAEEPAARARHPGRGRARGGGALRLPGGEAVVLRGGVGQASSRTDGD